MPASATWTADNVRASRQQEVLLSLAQSLKRKNPIQWLLIAPKVAGVCKTSLGSGDIFAMAPFLLGGFEMETLSIPGGRGGPPTAPYNDMGAWVYRYDTAAAAQHIHQFIYEE